MKDYSLG